MAALAGVANSVAGEHCITDMSVSVVLVWGHRGEAPELWHVLGVTG